MDNNSIQNSDILYKLSDEHSWQTEINQVRWLASHKSSSDLRVSITPARRPKCLFRGQTKKHDHCLPTLCRNIKYGETVLANLSIEDQLALSVNFLKSYWFCNVLKKHPAFIWANRQHVYINELAVAQHYGLPTGYLDLTQSFDVAAFFATCCMNKMTGKWEAIPDGEGIIYIFDYKTYLETVMPPLPGESRNREEYANEMISFENALSERLHVLPIGLQPLPRPAEQFAWTFELRLGQDFESMPCVKAIQFQRSQKVSNYFLDKFCNGEKLFPEDPISEIADEIIATKAVARELIDPLLEDYCADEFGISSEQKSELRSCLMLTAERKVDLPNWSPEQLQRVAYVWARKSKDLFRSVGFTVVRTTEDGKLELPGLARAFDDTGSAIFSL